MIGSYSEMPISEEHINMYDEVNSSLSRRLIVKTSPQVNLDSGNSILNVYGCEVNNVMCFPC